MLFGWAHLAFFGLVVPVAAFRTRRILLDRDLPPNRVAFYAGAIIQLVVFAGISIFVGYRCGIELFPRTAPTAEQAAIGLFVLVGLILAMRPQWRRSVAERERVVWLFMPSNRDERLLWLVVSSLAGFSEELTWRGVQYGVTQRLTGSIAIALALTAATFAIAHSLQGWKSVVVIAGFAIVFHGLVLLTKSLYVAMAVHAAYDAVVGLTYGRLGAELGYRAEDWKG